MVGKRNRWRAWLVHGLRVALVVGLLLAIPSPTPARLSDGSRPPRLADLPEIELLADAVEVDGAQDSSGIWPVRDSGGNVIAGAARTLPAARDIVGYRGPTEALIVVDEDLRIAAVDLLTSRDTEEHVAAVREDHRFFQQFVGWGWGESPTEVHIDGVSGATLTSLAMAEGVLKRLGGQRPSLVFTEPLSLADARQLYPQAAAISDAILAEAFDSRGRVLGKLFRTGRLVDDIVGYQGPTELLVAVSTEGEITEIQIRRSFDNEPYVGYVRQDKYSFWPAFEGRSLEQLASLDLMAAQVEGVSGATMTSMAVADTVVAASRELIEKLHREAERPVANRRAAWQSRWGSADVATMVVLMLAALITRLKWFRRRGARRVWLIGVVSVIGLWAGNLISLALVSGWAAEGVAWRLAPGLAAIAAVALITPPLSKSNPYCSHLCPHGAIQQLIRPNTKSRRRQKPPAWLQRILLWIPGITLSAAYVWLLMLPAADLASWEPFNVYLFRIAGWGSFTLAGVSLVAAGFVPMAYCRFGCPTGRLIDYLRRTAKSDRVQLADAVAVVLLTFALTQG